MPGMTIGIDCRFAAGSTGLSRYTREVVSALLKKKDENRYVLFCTTKHPSWLPKDAKASFTVKVVRAKHYSLWEHVAMPIAIVTSRINLLLVPHFNVPLYCPVPFIAVIHDLILHRYPNQASKTKYAAYLKLMSSTVSRAKRIVAVSKFTAKEIEKTYGKATAKKIIVVHEAVSESFSSKSGASCGPVLKKYSLNKPFFLYVGNSKEHKNVQTLIDAYATLNSTDTELVLVTGGPEVDRLTPVDGVRIIKDLPDEDLPCLYFFAACFVTASLYEGFGLPVLEAAAAGCPCILSNKGALPEIAPPGSKLVDPTVDAIAEALAEPPGPPEEKPTRTWNDVASDLRKVFVE
jgi:alpha-1,3-rhamnosyl/mannosyltransferase